MRKRELIEAIERADPQFFEPWLDLVYGVEQQAQNAPENAPRTDSV